jgi:FKBP-type peptidyl-prolyl cis-trans isomerase 2
MAKAKNGDTVKIHYTGKLEDGTVFDTSSDREPIQFTIGSNQVIAGLEKAVVGMNLGESKTSKITADQAYGPHRKEMLIEVERNEIPDDINLEVGQHLQIPQQNRRSIIVKVADISEEKVTLDANHPLAGKDLTFDIELVEIV